MNNVRPASHPDLKEMKERVKESREDWTYLFDTLLTVLLSDDMRPDDAATRIRQCAELADVALEELEKRWAS